MFRKVSLKTIIILFVALLALVVISKISDHKKGNRTFKKSLTEYDANQINKIQIYKGLKNKDTIEFTKNENKWTLSYDNKTFNGDNQIIGSMINELNNIHPSSVASTKKDRWKEYQVDDSSATRIKLFAGNELKGDIFAGKFSFSRNSGKSYIRIAGDNTTYGVSGMQSSSVNRKPDSFKDKTIISSEKNNWEKISYTYPSDSSFTMVKKDNYWEINGVKTDSVKTAGFLSTLNYVRHYNFAKSKPDKSTPDFELKIEGEKMSPIVVKGYNQNDKLIVTSNENEGVFFEGNDLKKKLFPGKSKFQK